MEREVIILWRQVGFATECVSSMPIHILAAFHPLKGVLSLLESILQTFYGVSQIMGHDCIVSNETGCVSHMEKEVWVYGR